MELYALKHGEGRGAEPSKEAESVLWPLFALGYWTEEQRMRVLTEGADVLARHLEKRHGHDTRLKSLWTAWALLLADEKDDGSAGDWEKNRQDR